MAKLGRRAAEARQRTVGIAPRRHSPDETTFFKQTTRKGRILNVNIQAWHQMLMRGTKYQKMYHHPFTLIRIHVTDNTKQSVWEPMWLIVMGNKREEISPKVAYSCYRQRFDIEHMLRFGKQRLLMTQFQRWKRRRLSGQTPDVEHEENWIQFVLLAYVQLWVTISVKKWAGFINQLTSAVLSISHKKPAHFLRLYLGAAKDLATHLPKPWERYSKQNNDKIITPSVVQRDFQRIISEIGTPARLPKPRSRSVASVMEIQSVGLKVKFKDQEQSSLWSKSSLKQHL